MQVFVIGDHAPTSVLIREALRQKGVDCPAGNLLPLGQPGPALAAGGSVLAVLSLAPHPEAALALLPTLKGKLRVVVVGPADSRLVLQAMRGGAHDFVDEAALEADLEVAVASWQVEALGPREEPGRLIGVLSPSGGSGSSTIAANVATALAREHKSSALVDLKLEVGDLASLLDLKPVHTLADLCLNVARMDRLLLERTLVRHASGVHLLAPPRQLSEVACVTPEGVREVLNLARASFPYVVVDLDHSFRAEQLQALRQLDILLLVLRLDFISLRNARRTLEYLDQLGFSRERVRAVVNRYGQPKEVPAAKAEEALGLKIMHYVPDDPKTVNRANNGGVPVILEAPSARVSKSVVKLAASVNGRHRAGVNGRAPTH